MAANLGVLFLTVAYPDHVATTVEGLHAAGYKVVTETQPAHLSVSPTTVLTDDKPHCFTDIHVLRPTMPRKQAVLARQGTDYAEHTEAHTTAHHVRGTAATIFSVALREVDGIPIRAKTKAELAVLIPEGVLPSLTPAATVRSKTHALMEVAVCAATTAPVTTFNPATTTISHTSTITV